jgi:pyruvate dehydrogenase E2 component (dihydrolipoamide acetyltransferase)
MRKVIILPQLELNMESVAVGRWLIKNGDLVSVEQPILEVETQKAVTQVPSPEVGYVRELRVKEGDTIGEKAELCILTDTADEVFAEDSPVIAEVERKESKGPVLPCAVTNEEAVIKAVPAARKLAKDLGVELATIKGTGPEGRINVADVKRVHLPGEGAGKAMDEWRDITPARVALISQMKKSLAEIPQIHIARQMDVEPLLLKQAGVTFTHRLVRVIALALSKHPALRTIMEENRTKVEAVSVAVAMDTSRGLVAPALRDPHQMSLEQISSTTNEFRSRAETGALKREELVNAPFALSNLGGLGVDFFNAFVFHGQTAVLAVGRSAVNETGGRRAWFNLAVDHRVVDGAEAARFLETLQTEILKP